MFFQICFGLGLLALLCVNRCRSSTWPLKSSSTWTRYVLIEPNLFYFTWTDVGVLGRIIRSSKLDDGVSWCRGGRSVIDLMLEIVGAPGDTTVADLIDSEELQRVAIGIKVRVDWIPPPISQSLKREGVQNSVSPKMCKGGEIEVK